LSAVTSLGVTAPPPGRPKAGPAPSGGSEPRAAGSVGVTASPPGRPKAGPAPSGGSDPRQRRSVGVTFTWPVRVYWEDTDAGGIVFYANYLKYFERARTEWLRSVGLEQQRLREQGMGMFVVTHSDLRYLRPARLDDLLSVSVRLLEVGRASLTIEQQVLCSAPTTNAVPMLLCEGSIRVGWVDPVRLRPQRIPTELLALLTGSG
jgi:acyl-CoA thioester hydrolase